MPAQDRIDNLSEVRLTSYAVRPGVVFPDWSRVRSATARTALCAVLEALDVEKRWGAGYEEALDRVRRAILEHYACEGRAPSLARLSADAGRAREELPGLLSQLRDRDLVVLDDGGEVIAGAYPFTDRKTGHLVRLGRETLNAMCAIDALGAGAMLGRDVLIESGCRFCGAPIHVETRGGGTSLKTCRPEAAVVWSGIAGAAGCAATSLCPLVVFFCSDEHLESWRGSDPSGAPGFRLSMDEAQQVGTALFAPMLAPADSEPTTFTSSNEARAS